MRYARRKFNARGFSAAELMIAVSITSIFAAGFYTAFQGMSAEMWRNKAYYDTSVSAKNAMDRMARDVGEAISLVVSQGGNTTGTTCLVLKLPSIDNTGAPTSISSQFDYVTYKVNPLDSTQLLRSLDVLNGVSSRNGGADVSNVVVAKKLNSVYFSYAGAALGSVAAATIPTLKYLNAQIATQGTTLGANQRTQLDSDLRLKNNIS